VVSYVAVGQTPCAFKVRDGAAAAVALVVVRRPDGVAEPSGCLGWCMRRGGGLLHGPEGLSWVPRKTLG